VSLFWIRQILFARRINQKAREPFSEILVVGLHVLSELKGHPHELKC
jgi:hypothetical protein